MTPLLDALLARPRRFRFDAAVRILLHAARTADPARAARFRSQPGLAFPPAEVTAARPGTPPQLSVALLGLTGASGTLPRYYTEMLGLALRQRSHALHDFLDLLAERLVAMFARAGMKYRPARAAEAATLAEPPAADPVAQALLAFTGYGTAQLLPRLAVGEAAVLHYAGLLAGAPRSAERLAALASDWLGRPVEVCQFAGAWMPLPPDERSALAAGREPGRWNRLGVDAAIGVRAWDAQARIVLRVGPLGAEAFAALLPGEPGLHRFVSLVRAFLGLQTGFAVNLVLAGDAVPPLCLGGAAPSRLGWTSWLPRVGARADAAEAMFEAERVEAAV